MATIFIALETEFLVEVSTLIREKLSVRHWFINALTLSCLMLKNGQTCKNLNLDVD